MVSTILLIILFLIILGTLIYFLKIKGIFLSLALIVGLLLSVWLISNPIMLQKSTDLSGLKIANVSLNQKINQNEVSRSEEDIQNQETYVLQKDSQISIGVRNQKTINISSITADGLPYKTIAEAKSKLSEYKEYSTDQYPHVIRFVDKENSMKFLLFSNDGKSIDGYWIGKI
jgi:hypothetical protein